MRTARATLAAAVAVVALGLPGVIAPATPLLAPTAAWLATTAILLTPGKAFAQDKSPSSAADIDAALDLYRYRLLFMGTKMRAYPKEAMEQRITGTATVDIGIGADGRLQKSALAASSGHAILDRYALELLAAAVPLTEIPSPLHNTAFNLRVVVVFALPP